MYALFLADCQGSLGTGWLKGIKQLNYDRVNNQPSYVKAPRHEVIIAGSNEEIKTWKNLNSAIKYANTLSERLKTVEYVQCQLHKFNHNLRWLIRVVDTYNGNVVHEIKNYAISLDHS